jgi:Tol biopolymer transport system component/DNA-binding winged helix-turn-helix (wHTH) protein
MAELAPADQLVRFQGFELNLQTGELRKGGTRVRLQDQPFKVLVALVQRPGQLVTREELRRLIWPEHSFGDFDHAINLAVTKLRGSLGDSADVPHLIETLPRRGYRFIAPVESPGTEVDEPNRSAALSRTAKRTNHLASIKGLVLLFSFLGFLLLAVVIVWLNARSPSLPTIGDSGQITNDGLPKDAILVTDGARLYFIERPNDVPSLVQVSVAGGETARTAVPLQYNVLFDISPAHSEFLMNTGGFSTEISPDLQLWSMPVLGGSPHRIGEIQAHDACWAPDGDHIAYASGQALYLAMADGSEARKLTSVDGSVSWIRFSPDGRRLRFSVGDIKHFPSVWEVMLSGRDLHRLTDGCCGSWSPDGKYYYFWNWGIWVLPERRSILHRAGSAPVKLTTEVLNLQAPVPSLDGKKLFVVGIQGRGELLRYDRKAKEFVPFLGGISATEVDVSRDGQWVTYTTYPEFAIWRSRVDGSDRLQLTFPPMNAHEPRWSPDGRQIVFNDFPSKLFVVSAEGGTPRQLMPEDHPDLIGAATWSPDGDSIVFGQWTGTMDSIASYRLDFKTNQASKLQSSEHVYSARLSPDGRYLSAFRLNQHILMLYDFSTQTWSELGRGNYSFNNWSHDGKFVYVRNLIGGDRGTENQQVELDRIRISDHKVERIFSLKDMTPPGWAGWISLDADDSPILMRDRSTQEIYRFDLQFR